jgi:ketosteroid isomerase-like protein
VTDSANVELVRSIYAAWERGDFSSADWADPEIEFVWADGPIQNRGNGLAAMASAQRDWLEAWEDVRQLPGEYRELDHTRALALHQFSARGKRSGLQLGPIRRDGAAVFTIDNGRVVRLVHYFDRERALADLGLTPEADSSA